MPEGFIPSGFDRATGEGIFPGTPTPAGTIVGSGSGSYFEELPTSPTIERGEQGTIIHTFKCDSETGMIYVASLPRGAIMTDSDGNTTRVLTSTFVQQTANLGILTVTAESISFDVPPDEFAVEPIELNPSLFRHPRYATVVNYVGVTTGGAVTTGAQIIATIQGATNYPSIPSQSEAAAQLTAAQITNSSVLALAQELFGFIQRGFDTFYLAGWRVTYSYYDFQPIDLNPGGYIQDPVASGALPSYFWQDGDGDNIFTSLSATVAPQFYEGGISWLRQSDAQVFQRTWFKLTQTWIGGPFGTWNPIIYGSDPAAP